MENDGITWEEICAYVDTLHNSGEPEYQQENRQKTRVVKLKWDPIESAAESEVSITPGETLERARAYVDTLHNSSEPEYQQENRQKTRVVRLKWDPDAGAHSIYFDEIVCEVEKNESNLS